MNFVKLLAVAAFTGLVTGPAMAQMAPPPKAEMPSPDAPELRAAKQEHATRMITSMRRTWTEEEVGRILYIGWYSATANMCDDLEIDQVKLGKALASVLGPELEKAAADKQQHLSSMLSLHVGMATGYIMASHVLDVDRVCAQGRDAVKGMPANTHLFQITQAQ
jgi:hypothetical protein